MAPTLRGRRVTLRPPVDADIETRLRLGYDAEIHRLYGGSRDTLRPMTREHAASWFNWLARHSCGWAIEHMNLIGDIRLDNVDAQDRRASLAIGIANPAALGRGLGTEAIALVCRRDAPPSPVGAGAGFQRASRPLLSKVRLSCRRARTGVGANRWRLA